ncbi:MAG: hypothetical protein K8S54_00205 [Spirochaetia bacterium]|nr:hypothetical protein [Spirochaetia bacterium]
MPSSSPAFQFTRSALADSTAELAIFGVLQHPTSDEILKDTWLDGLESLSPGATEILAQEKFDGSRDKVILLRNPKGTSGPARIIVTGLGRAARLRPAGLTTALKAAFDRAFGVRDVSTVALALPELELAADSVILAAVDATHDAGYASREAKKPGRSVAKVDLLVKGGIEEKPQALKESIAIATARAAARDLTNMPPNVKRTSTLSERAQGLAGLANVSVDVISDPEWIQKNMPCFYTVAMGSLVTDPPKFIRVHYKPANAKKRIILVGKSVIFDTGGYQVKTDDYMNTMKADMTGGSMVLAAIEAFAKLEIQGIELAAYLAATPNMIDAYAMLPDSIVDTTCGKKVEIRHTDAEGRLTLIDAVAKACEESPDLIITIATLTGSAARAVGEAIALMGNNDPLRDRLRDAAKLAGDPVQTLDIWDEDFEDIKSKLDGADIINTSQNKNRGAQSACAFVMSGLTREIPLLHLDIAGADMTKDEKATGIGIKAVLKFLIAESQLI